MTRREHIEKLAGEIGAEIRYEGRRYRMAADMIDRVLILAPWDLPVEDGGVPEEELYWVALHEMGHLETSDIWARVTPEDVTEDEARAWVWALDNSIFPLDQAGESSIAWGMTDYAWKRGWRPSPALARLVATLGPDPDWFMNVTTEDHWRKLDDWARPTWRAIVVGNRAEAAA